MAYKGLYDFIDHLERAGELIRVKSFVNPTLEMAEIADRLVKAGGKAVLFENTGTNFPVLINAMGTYQRMCMALGVNDLDDIAKSLEDIFKDLSSPQPGWFNKLKLLPSLGKLASWMPKSVAGRGACQEVIMETADISRIPVITCWPHDGGPFITFPVVNTLDPVSGQRNVGMYRMQVYDGTTTGMHWHLHKNSARHYHEYKKLGKRMPVSVILGGDPAYTYSATAPLPDHVDEYLLAGFLRRKSVELVKCITNDLEVPADADFVIEGYVDPAEDLRVEGPFGDHTGYYSLEDDYPVFHITCITHRKNAVYPTTIVGIPPQEDLYLGKATERIFLMPIRMAMLPEIVDMAMPAEGVFHNLVIVKIKQTYPGQAIKVMNSLWGAGQMMFNKVMIVVDEDVDIHDPQQVIRAVLSHCQPNQDVYFTKGPVDVLDHASVVFAFGGKMGLDATRRLKNSAAAPDFPTSVKILPLAKTRKNEAMEEAQKLLERGELKEVKVLVFIEEVIEPDDYSSIVWRVANNIDPQRDCRLLENGSGGVLVIDGTRKSLSVDGFERPWPNIVASSLETIEKVDQNWESWGLGEFIPSPSRKYLQQLYPGKARVEE